MPFYGTWGDTQYFVIIMKVLKSTKNQIHWLLIFVFFLLVFTWMYNATRNIRYAKRVYVPVTEHFRVIAFGDSLAEGLGATYGNDFVSLLSDHLDEPILNLGKRGDTTSSALLRIDDVLVFKPEIVMVSLGGNDVLHNIPIENRLENITSIITTFQKNNIQVLFLIARTGIFQDKYKEDIMQLLNKYHVVYVENILDDILYHPWNLFDPIHPNDRGHEIIANRIEPILQNMLREMVDSK